MDLRQQFPRSVRDTLGGYVHLPRMIDKGRAVLTHTLGEYIFPCSLDQRLLDVLGLSPERFLQAVEEHGDSRIEGWLRQHTLSHTPQEIMDWNQTQLARGPDSEEKLNYFTQTRNAIDPCGPQPLTFSRSISARTSAGSNRPTVHTDFTPPAR